MPGREPSIFNPSFSPSHQDLGVFDEGAEKFPGVKLMKSFRLCKLSFESEHLDRKRGPRMIALRRGVVRGGAELEDAVKRARTSLALAITTS